jgi:hypothetical protein
LAKNLNKFNPDAMVFEPGCKLGGNFTSSRRKDEPDDELAVGFGCG